MVDRYKSFKGVYLSLRLQDLYDKQVEETAKLREELRREKPVQCSNGHRAAIEAWGTECSICQIAELKKENSILQAKLSELQAENEKLRGTLYLRNDLIESQKVVVQRLESHYRHALEDNEKLRGRISRLVDDELDEAKMQAEKETVEAKYEKLKSDCERLQKDHATNLKSYDIMQVGYEELIKRYADQTDRLNALKEDHESLRSSYEGLKRADFYGTK